MLFHISSALMSFVCSCIKWKTLVTTTGSSHLTWTHRFCWKQPWKVSIFSTAVGVNFLILSSSLFFSYSKCVSVSFRSSFSELGEGFQHHCGSVFEGPGVQQRGRTHLLYHCSGWIGQMSLIICCNVYWLRPIESEGFTKLEQDLIESWLLWTTFLILLHYQCLTEEQQEALRANSPTLLFPHFLSMLYLLLSDLTLALSTISLLDHHGIQAEAKQSNGNVFRRNLLNRLQQEFNGREETRRRSLQEWVCYVTFICNIFDYLKVRARD